MHVVRAAHDSMLEEFGTERSRGDATSDSTTVSMNSDKAVTAPSRSSPQETKRCSAPLTGRAVTTYSPTAHRKVRSTVRVGLPPPLKAHGHVHPQAVSANRGSLAVPMDFPAGFPQGSWTAHDG